MGVQITGHKMPLMHLRLGLHAPLDVRRKVFFRARGTTRDPTDMTGRHLEIDDERSRAVADVLKLPPFDLAGSLRQAGVFAF